MMALNNQLIIAVELGYIGADHGIFSHLDKASRLLTGLHKSVKE